jgi:type I restriction enzyme, S subunit
MSKWKKITIGEFADFNPTEKIEKGRLVKKIPMAMLTEFQRKIKGFELSHYKSGPKFRNGDTLVAKITPCLENGKTAQVNILENDEVAFGSSEFIVLRENQNSTNDYIFYLAKSPVFRERAIRCMEGTSGRKRVNEAALKRQTILVPDKATQHKVASILSVLDDKIDLNNKINEELEKIVKTIYDYWFMQYDFPDKHGKPYKSSGGKMVYNEVLKRNIPKDWKEEKLEDFIANNKSGDWGKEKQEGNYTKIVQCIRGTDINAIIGKSEIKAPVRYILEKNVGKILGAGDLVIEISGGSPIQSTGRLAYLTDEVFARFKHPLICSNFCKAVTLKKENQFFYFIYSWNKAYDNNTFFGFEGKTTGIKNLLFDTLVSQYYIVVPPENILNQFQQKASLLEKQRQINLIQNQHLSELRDWLLPMLMNGQVSVTETEEMLSIAAEQENIYK